MNENSSCVSLDFNHISEEFRIVRICRFQCIGWILGAVSQTEVEVNNGATWINPEASVQALMEIPHVPEYLARKLIASGSTEERFNLTWNYIDDDEKNTAITINFDHYNNFWPGFQFYAKAIALHIANTQRPNEFKVKVKELECQLTNSLATQTPAQDTPMESSTSNLPIDYIENPRYHTNNNDRQVIYKSPLTPSYDDLSEGPHFRQNITNLENEDAIFGQINILDK